MFYGKYGFVNTLCYFFNIPLVLNFHYVVKCEISSLFQYHAIIQLDIVLYISKKLINIVFFHNIVGGSLFFEHRVAILKNVRQHIFPKVVQLLYSCGVFAMQINSITVLYDDPPSATVRMHDTGNEANTNVSNSSKQLAERF